MQIKLETLKTVCGKILPAVDTSELSRLSDTLQIKTVNDTLVMRVSNREYVVDVKIPVGDDVVINATVNASLFLNLVNNFTTEYVDLTTDDKTLYVSANGDYKFPLIFDGDKLLDIPDIEFDTVTTSGTIASNVLRSIVQYNSKEIASAKGVTATNAIQNMYYVDKKGCITFANCSCVNSFVLDTSVKFLFTDKFVRLFKLFDTDDDVAFDFGFKQILDSINQTVIRFVTDKVTMTFVLANSDNLLNSVPADSIRRIASEPQKYSVVVSKVEMLSALKRLSLFNPKTEKKIANQITFMSDKVVLMGADSENKEEITVFNESEPFEYTASVFFSDIKSVLESTETDTITIGCGDKRTLIVSRNDITNIIPEVVVPTV